MPKTQEGHYFLDADPDLFKVILNWLRLGIITTNDSNLYTGVIALADYLGLDQLKNAIEDRKKTNDIQERKKQINPKLITSGLRLFRTIEYVKE